MRGKLDITKRNKRIKMLLFISAFLICCSVLFASFIFFQWGRVSVDNLDQLKSEQEIILYQDFLPITIVDHALVSGYDFQFGEIQRDRPTPSFFNTESTTSFFRFLQNSRIVDIIYYVNPSFWHFLVVNHFMASKGFFFVNSDLQKIVLHNGIPYFLASDLYFFSRNSEGKLQKNSIPGRIIVSGEIYEKNGHSFFRPTTPIVTRTTKTLEEVAHAR